MANLQQSFEKLMNASFVNYKGCLIELPSFRALGKEHNSFAEAKLTIDNAFSSLKNTIR